MAPTASPSVTVDGWQTAGGDTSAYINRSSYTFPALPFTVEGWVNLETNGDLLSYATSTGPDAFSSNCFTISSGSIGAAGGFNR